MLFNRTEQKKHGLIREEEHNEDDDDYDGKLSQSSVNSSVSMIS
jgi:hypothetical protein